MLSVEIEDLTAVVGACVVVDVDARRCEIGRKLADQERADVFDSRVLSGHGDCPFEITDMILRVAFGEHGGDDWKQVFRGAAMRDWVLLEPVLARRAPIAVPVADIKAVPAP